MREVRSAPEVARLLEDILSSGKSDFSKDAVLCPLELHSLALRLLVAGKHAVPRTLGCAVLD